MEACLLCDGRERARWLFKPPMVAVMSCNRCLSATHPAVVMACAMNLRPNAPMRKEDGTLDGLSESQIPQFPHKRDDLPRENMCVVCDGTEAARWVFKMMNRMICDVCVDRISASISGQGGSACES